MLKGWSHEQGMQVYKLEITSIVPKGEVVSTEIYYFITVHVYCLLLGL